MSADLNVSNPKKLPVKSFSRSLTHDEIAIKFGARKLQTKSSRWSFNDDEIERYKIARYVWSIANFDKKMSMENGKDIQSERFSISYKGITTDWYLTMYPNGEDYEEEGYVSLLLNKASETPEPVKVEAIFWTVNHQGVKVHSFKLNSAFQSKEEEGYGTFKYEKHTKISLNGSKTYTILCELCLLGDMVPSSSGTNESSLINRPPHNMSSFVESGEFSDCIVKCGDKEYNCHKIILAGSSTVFKAMFSNDFKEKKSSKIVIEDLEESTVTELIHYIYSGKVRNLNDQAIKLLLAADMYDLRELKETCELYLRHNISEANVCDILIAADLYNLKMLEDSAFRFVTENGNAVVDQGFEDKLKLFPHILIRLLKTSLK